MKGRREGLNQQQAGAKAGLRSRKTVSRYERAGILPSEMRRPREYLTHEDAFAGDWPEVEVLLKEAPGLEAKVVFEWLQAKEPGKYGEGQLRTFQRRVQQWRGLNQDRDVVLEQVHVPGEAMQTDGTWMNRHGITVDGLEFGHLLIHTVLPYSNWEWATVAQSESLLAIEGGLKAALRELGAVPQYHQTDNSTAATHRLGVEEREAEGRDRGYNEDYLALLAGYGMKPRTTHLSRPQENGDVESSNGGLKRAIEQALLLRGSRDFGTRAEYEAFVVQILRGRNAGRSRRLAEELAVMRSVTVASKPVKREIRAKVSRAATIFVLKQVYSVPSSLVGQEVRVWVSEWEIEVRFAGKVMRRLPRVVGQSHKNIDYRHVIDSLLRKPGGFRRYRYRDDLFPGAVFALAWEDLCARKPPRQADMQYLRILKLAATNIEADVAAELERLLDAGDADWDSETLQASLAPREVALPQLEILQADPGDYDRLLTQTCAAMAPNTEVVNVAAD